MATKRSGSARKSAASAKTPTKRKSAKTSVAGPNGSKNSSPKPVAENRGAIEPENAPKWTFLTNHAHVLAVLDSNPDLVLRHVALYVGITERAVQRIIGDLEESGFLEVERVGRKNHYRVLKHNPLRHPVEAHRTIGDLLAVIAQDD